jgi:hypothetical protein
VKESTVSYAEEHPDSILGSSFKVLRILQKNPLFVYMFVFFYFSSAAAFYLYVRETRQAREWQQKAERLQDRVSSVAIERDVFLQSSRNSTIDVFKRLSFLEKSTPQDQEKLQAALSLNSFAKYALHNRDLRKARETLDESTKTFPTLEAQYYLGVVNYLEGNTEAAVGSWKPLAKSAGVPDDIFIYLSVAEYHSGNTQAAKEFADLYSRKHTD